MKLNPFAHLPRELVAKVLAEFREKAQSEKRLAALLAEYGEMAQDPRYKSSRAETTLIMGDTLRDLVDHAVKCGPLAAKVKLLQEVVAEPLEAVWFERQQEDVPPSGDPDSEENVMG